MSIDVSSIPFPASGISSSPLFFVMPGLEPGIHVFLSTMRQDMDGRDKPGHDEFNYFATRDATSAIAFMTALRTPGSYSVWPAPSTTRTSASVQRAARSCATDGGHKRS